MGLEGGFPLADWSVFIGVWLIQAWVRSTTQRRGWARKPLPGGGFGRDTMSMSMPV